MRRVFLTKSFARFARKAGLPDATLHRAAMDVVHGRYDADLGGGVYKQRVAREGGGKSAGFRVLLLFRAGKTVFFIHGFAKSAQANVSDDTVRALKQAADLYLALSEGEIRVALAAGEIMEVIDDGEEDTG